LRIVRERAYHDYYSVAIVVYRLSLYHDFSIGYRVTRLGYSAGLSPKIERVFSTARFISVKVCGYLLGTRFDADANHCLRCATIARP